MPEGKVSCVCGKQYTWKPEFAGKRAKCKCGNVVTFSATRPGGDESSPEGFDDMGEIPMAPPPPPPMAGAGVGGGPPPPPPPPRMGSHGAIVRGSMPKSGGRVGAGSGSGGSGFTFSGKALWNIIVGIGLIALGIFLFTDISSRESEGRTVRYRGRKMGWLNLMYMIGGKWGVLGFFGLIGLGLIVFAVMVMMGTKDYSEDE